MMGRDVCAVDFTTTSVQVAVRTKGGGAVASESVLPEDAVREGRVLQPETVQFYIKRLVRNLNVKPSEVRVSLSDAACVSRIVDFPRMPARDLRRSLLIEAGRELPITPRSSYVGWQYLDHEGKRRRLMLVAAWRDVVEGYLEALQGIGKVTVVEPRSHAVARAVGLPDCVLMDWTDEMLQVSSVEGCNVTYTTCVPGPTSGADNPTRLVHMLVSLLPRRGSRVSALEGKVVLLGKLRGRHDVAEALREATHSEDMTAVVDWTPDGPFAEIAGAGHTANIGLLMRN